MKVREIMSPNPITLSPTQKVNEVISIFIANKIDGAPVVNEQGKIVGLFTKSHIYQVISNNMDMNTKVEHLMTREVITGYPDDDFIEVVNPNVPRLPVIDETGKVIGILTRGDIADAFFNLYNNIYCEYHTIINSAYNVIVSVDNKGIIKTWNKAAEMLLGRAAKDVIGKNILDVLPNSDLHEIIKSGKVEPLKKKKFNNRYFISNRSPIIKDGEIIGAIAVLQDISDIEKLSSELSYVKELNKELNAIVESSFDGLFITDGKGTILRYNNAFEQLTGINAHEYLGKTVDDIRRDGIISDPVTSYVLEQKKPLTVMQESRSGKLTLTTGNPVFDDKGRIIRVVCNVRDITELNTLKQELEKEQQLNQHYENQLRTMQLKYTGHEKLVFTSSTMMDLVDLVIRLAKVDSTILITGESGTGKELIAEIIHNNSERKSKPFIKVNCGAIPESLLESELFGYEGGAFTGAKKEGKPGLIELAAGGTLFLDEIGEIPLSLQVKLLRFLQNKEISRVGGEKNIYVDVRIISATNRCLYEMVQQKLFREDLYYRLNVVPVKLPPLRERKVDIPPLVAHFTKIFNKKYHKNKSISPGVIEVLMQYDWPGNVRELENVIERIIVTSIKDVITVDDLPPFLWETVNVDSPNIIVTGIVPLKEAIESVEKQLLEKVYATFRTTRQMAKELKVDASTVVRKAAKYHITKNRPEENLSL